MNRYEMNQIDLDLSAALRHLAAAALHIQESTANGFPLPYNADSAIIRAAAALADIRRAVVTTAEGDGQLR